MDTSFDNSTKQLDLLREQISGSLEKAQTQKNTLKRDNARYKTANIVLSGFATLLAATAGLLGDEGWKPVCILAAFCSAGATVTANLQTGEQLTDASECVGQLKALKVETIFPTYDLEHAREKYEQILSQFSAIDC
jgi:hypothetical protein